MQHSTWQHIRSITDETKRTLWEISVAPFKVVQRATREVVSDACQIANSGLPAIMVGAPLAILTLPLAPLSVPITMGMRVGGQTNTPVGSVFGGMVGGLAGIGLAVWALELAWCWHAFEVFYFASEAHKKALLKFMEEQARLKEQAATA